MTVPALRALLQNRIRPASVRSGERGEAPKDVPFSDSQFSPRPLALPL